MKILYLTGIATTPNDLGYEKINKATEDKKTKKPNWGDLGLPTPNDELEYDEDGRVLLTKNDLEEVGTSVNIVLDTYGGAEDDLDGGCTVYTTYGVSYDVAETADEVANYAEMLHMNYIQRNWIFLRLKIKALLKIN